MAPQSTSDLTPGEIALPRVIAFANQKGGVGKTTTAITVAACLAELEYRVLVVDLDPQGNASTGLGINARDLDATIYDVLLRGEKLENCIEPTAVKNLFVAPANLDLAGADIELVPEMGREQRLKKAIDTVLDQYDYVILDCPPSLGLLTVNGLTAATEVFVPIQCEYFALEGLSKIYSIVDQIRECGANPNLHISGILMTMYMRNNLAQQVIGEVQKHFGDVVFKTIIPRTVRLGEAPSHGKTIFEYEPGGLGATAYRYLANEFSARESAQATQQLAALH